ncbi:MAG TPA: hypothetical protein VFU92_09235 [Usitatibacter sp.]|nr:hypothetical protein [Usitatibacter sp.]
MKTAVDARPETFADRKAQRTSPPADNHDLPLLAAAEDSRYQPPWESLLDDGVQPALILGAERRSSGGRR